MQKTSRLALAALAFGVLALAAAVPASATDLAVPALSFTGGSPPTGYTVSNLYWGSGTVGGLGTVQWPYQQLWDGANKSTIKAASTAPLSTDTALVVTTRDAVSIAPSQTIGATQSGTWATGRTWALGSGTDSVAIGGTLPAFAATPTVNIGTAPTLSVTGTFWQATQPVSNSTEHTDLQQLHTDITTGAIPAGTNTIGAVTPGVLPAGTLANNSWRASTGNVTTTTQTAIDAGTGTAESSGNYAYVTDLECSRDDGGSAAVSILLNDSGATKFVLPNSGGGGGWTRTFSTPLRIATTNLPLKITAGTATTNIYCSAQGFFAAN